MFRGQRTGLGQWYSAPYRPGFQHFLTIEEIYLKKIQPKNNISERFSANQEQIIPALLHSDALYHRMAPILFTAHVRLAG